MNYYIKTLFLAGIPFGITMGIFFGVTSSSFSIGILSGSFVGVVFGLVISTFVVVQKNKFKKTSLDTTEGKEILFDGAANHFQGREAVGGWLYLTKEELIFKSHSFNIQTHQIKIPLSRIDEVRKTLTLGFIPNGLIITTKDKIVQKFVVSNRNTWVQKISTCKSMTY